MYEFCRHFKIKKVSKLKSNVNKKNKYITRDLRYRLIVRTAEERKNTVIYFYPIKKPFDENSLEQYYHSMVMRYKTHHGTMRKLRDFFIKDAFYDEEVTSINLFNAWFNFNVRSGVIPDGIVKLHHFYLSKFNKDVNDDEEGDIISSSDEDENEFEPEEFRILNQLVLNTEINHEHALTSGLSVFKPKYQQFKETICGPIADCLEKNWLSNNKRHGHIKNINFFENLQKFSLKPRQQIIFDFIRRFKAVHMQNKQLLFQIQGKAGTGKSVLIAHIVSLFRKEEILTCAHSGTAANHINSPTTYYLTFFFIMILKYSSYHEEKLKFL